MVLIIWFLGVLSLVFHGRELENPAVVLIDMQSKMLDCLELEKRYRLIENQLEIIRRCAALNIPVLVLEYEGEGETDPTLQKELEGISRKALLKKKSNDGFKNTQMDKLLTDWNVRSIIMMGMQESVCVLETTQSALKKGYCVATSSQIIDGFLELSFGGKMWYRLNCLHVGKATDIFKFVK